LIDWDRIDGNTSGRYLESVSELVLHLPVRPDQNAFNLLRWEELQNDSSFQGFEGRIETDRHGRVIMSPPPSRFHGNFQSQIVHKLIELIGKGEVVTECPISTEDGVKSADVAWLSPELSRKTADQGCLEVAPEICVEVISPSNTDAEMNEKTALYFAAGAKEVWHCEKDGRLRFFVSPTEEKSASAICPGFPKTL